MERPGRRAATLSLSSDGRFVAISMSDRLEVRDVDRGRIALAQTGRVLHTEFTADSRRIVIGCRDGSIVAFDLATGQERRSPQNRLQTVALRAASRWNADCDRRRSAAMPGSRSGTSSRQERRRAAAGRGWTGVGSHLEPRRVAGLPSAWVTRIGRRSGTLPRSGRWSCSRATRSA